MSTTPNTTPYAGASITLHLVETPAGVQLRADGDLTGHGEAASVAWHLCRFAEGLFVRGRNVLLDPEIVKAVL